MFNERYFSNLHNMIIPLYGFNHYHSASNCEENTEGFIGRDSIIDKLSAWLDAPKGKTAYSGAYLITGYRGMGKSSFVHKAVEKLSPKPKGFLERIKRLREPKYVIVTVNVGNELLTTKELLGMVCKVAAKRFGEEFSGLKVTSLRRSRNTVISSKASYKLTGKDKDEIQINSERVKIKVKKWSDIIEDARRRLSYMSQLLKTCDVNVKDKAERDFAEINFGKNSSSMRRVK